MHSFIIMPLDQIDIDQYDPNTDETKEMSFIDHLEEFRWVLFRSLIGIGIATIVVFGFKSFFIDEVLFGPTKPSFVGYKFLCSISQYLPKKDLLCFDNELSIQNLKLSGQFMAHFQISFIMGAVIAFPWVFWQLWLFVKPALYDQEKKAMSYFTFFAWMFFVLGILFGYFIVLPFSLNFFANYNLNDSLTNLYQLNDYIGYITMTTLSAGLMFEMPMVIFILSKIGLINPTDLKQYRRHAFVIILILSAIITPPDIISQFLIAIPVYLLYEFSILVSRWVIQSNKSKSTDHQVN